MGGTNLKAGLPLLEALSMIESGNNDRAIGRAGEVSRYQILPVVWKRYCQARNYGDKDMASCVAEEHLGFQESRFRALSGREPTDFDRYVMWNAGVEYYRRTRFSPKGVHRIIRERALRFVNLRQMPAPPEPLPPPQMLAVGGLSVAN